MEIVNPSANQPALGIAPGPKSPVKQWASPAATVVNSFRSPTFGHNYKISQASASTFDEKVLEQDKARNQDEMEKLYAAVMAHDVKKSPPKQNNAFDHAPLKSPNYYPTASQYSDSDYTLHSPNSHPPQQQQQHNDISYTPLTSPTYNPPELQHLRTQTNTVRALSHPLAPSPVSPVEGPSRSASLSQASTKVGKAVSFLSGSRASSANSSKSRPGNISIRNLPISPPLGSLDLSHSAAYDQTPPLSARIYSPGPPPATPAQKSAAAVAREMDSKPAMRAPAPAPLPLRSSAANSQRSLPFREAYASPPSSAPATKVTYLERRESILHPAPKTGVPHTPYTPYQPFTPITPVTPGRLVTKEERKRAKKQEGRKVLSDDDMVKSDEDMWS
jgi:hypothetical protein